VTTTGAENGLEQVTHLARGMVGGWGTSERAGRPTAVPSDAQQAYGLSTAPAAPDAVDSGMRRLADERCADALRLLEDHRDRPDALPQALLENETPGEDAAYRAAGVTRPAEPDT
jgi:cell division protease FtsH